jgi:hypothetical protein
MSRRRTVAVWTVGLAALFGFRLAFGLSSEFFFEDQTQIFLIGLRYYATGRWPYFGPDVVWTRSQIPGALQGLLVGLPLHVVPAPESSFVALNLLSFAALCLLAWYLTRILPSLPKWLVYGWLLTVPWTLQFSTTMLNPSFAYPAAIAFFVGFFEAVPVFTLGLLRPVAAHAIMGAAVVWVAQFHLSWPLLGPFALGAWLSRWRDGAGALARNAAAAACGAAVPFLFIAPTLVKYGASAGSGGTGANVAAHFVNPWVLVTSLARFLSFTSLEISRWIGTDGAKRLELFEHHKWLAAPAAVVWMAGIAQPVWMLVELCRPAASFPLTDRRSQWRTLRLLVAASIVLVYASYFFVIEPPQAHAFFVLSPIAFVVAAFCWARVDSPRSRRWARWILAANVVFHTGLAIVQFSERSLYRRRDIVVAAIRSRNIEILGHRRPFAIDAGPYEIDRSIPRDARRDVVFSNVAYVRRFDGSVHWSLRVENNNPRVAFRDVLYFATYRRGDGSELVRHEFIKDIFEPCDSRTVELNDGYVRTDFVDATIRVAAAEALTPASSACPDR